MTDATRTPPPQSLASDAYRSIVDTAVDAIIVIDERAVVRAFNR